MDEDYEYIADEKRNVSLDARVDDAGIVVSITEWAECFVVTMPKEQARAFGEWLLKVS